MHDPSQESSVNETLQQALREFKQAWLDGKAPKLAGFLDRFGESTPAVRNEAVYRLALAELQLRQQAGESVSASEYREQFPELAGEQFDEFLTLPAPPDIQRKPLLPSRYEVLEQIGQGGLGEIWSVRDRNLQRQLAAKVLRESLQPDPQANVRLQKEAILTGSLQHPGVPPLVEQGKLLTGSSFFTMKLIRGHTLYELFRERCNSRAEQSHLLRILQQVAQAVAFSHTRGIIHCDLKPHNVMVGEFGEVQVMDWGLARRWKENDGLNDDSAAAPASAKMRIGDAPSAAPEGPADSERTGHFSGSPSYMAPEQAAGRTRELDPRTDVYALAGILYELLTGQPPFRGDTVSQTLKQAREQDPAPVKDLNPKTPADLATICHKGLARDPQQRYVSAVAFADDLERYMDGRPIGPLAKHQRVWKWVKRRPAIAGVVLLGIVSLAGMITIGVGSVFYSQLQIAHATAVSERKQADALRADAQTKNGKIQQLLDTTQAQKTEAERLQLLAETAENSVRQLLYAADIGDAHAAWTANEIAETHRILDRHIPHAGQNDLRGFEWGYLKRICQGANLDIPSSGAFDAKFSPDGKEVAVARRSTSNSLFGFVTIYDAQTGKPLPGYRRERFPFGFPNRDSVVQFRSDGKRLAVITPTSLSLLDYPSGDKRFEFIREGGLLGKVDFSPNGKRIAFVYRGNRMNRGNVIRVLDAESGEEIAAIPSPKSSGDQSDNGNWVDATLTNDKLIAATRDVLYFLNHDGKQAADPIRNRMDDCVVRSPNAHVAVALGYSQAWLIDSATNSIVHTFDIRPQAALVERQVSLAHVPFRVPFPRSQKPVCLLAYPSGNAIRIASSLRSDMNVVLRGHQRAVSSVAFSTVDSNRLVSTSEEDGRVMIWDWRQAAGYPATVIKVPEDRSPVRYVYPLAARRNGSEIAIALPAKTEAIHLWSTRRQRQTEVIRLPKQPLCAAYADDNSRMAVGLSDGSVSILDLDTKETIAVLRDSPAKPIRILFDSSGHRLACYCDDDVLRVWDLKLTELKHRLDCGKLYISSSARFNRSQLGLAFHPTDNVLAGVGPKGSIRIWNTKSGEVIANFPTQIRAVRELVFTPNGKDLIAAGNTIERWTISNSLRTVIPSSPFGSRDGFRRVTVSPDGRRLFATATDASCRVFDLTINRELLTLRTSANQVTTIANDADYPDCLVLLPNGVLMTAQCTGDVFLFDGSERTHPTATGAQEKQF